MLFSILYEPLVAKIGLERRPDEGVIIVRPLLEELSVAVPRFMAGKGANAGSGSVTGLADTSGIGLRECASVAQPPKKPKTLAIVSNIWRIFLKFFIFQSLSMYL
jgi:hypothetical protein